MTDFWLSPGLAGELWDHDGVGLEMSDRPKIRLNLHHCTIHNILIWKQNKQTNLYQQRWPLQAQIMFHMWERI